MTFILKKRLPKNIFQTPQTMFYICHCFLRFEKSNIMKYFKNAEKIHIIFIVQNHITTQNQQLLTFFYIQIIFTSGFFFSLKIKCNIQLKASSIFFFSLSKDSDSSEAVNRQLLEQLLPNRASFPSITSPSHTHQLLFLHSFSVSFIPKLVSTMLS